jgi:hypothetical protein
MMVAQDEAVVCRHEVDGCDRPPPVDLVQVRRSGEAGGELAPNARFTR